MMSRPPLQQTATHLNLRRLFWMRNLVMAFLVAISWLLFILDIPVQLFPLAGAITGMLALNLATWFRLMKSGKVSELELLLQLLGDIATLSVLFYYTGGYSNPLIWMYLLPLSIAAVALPERMAWLLTAIAVLCYSLLVFFHVPLSHLHLHYREGVGLDTHLAGMWLGFVACAVLLAAFVSRIGHNLREYDRVLAKAREKVLESERMLALGTLATAAAHELGTPLATMAVLASEMAEECADHPPLAASLALLRGQITRCKEILTSITASAGKQRAGHAPAQALDAFLEETTAHWRDGRPATPLDCALRGSLPAPMIVGDRTLAQALHNLLDNAADASPQHIALHGEWRRDRLRLEIRDYGPGLSQEAADLAGTPFFTTKQEGGMGLGLYLARCIFERFGGGVLLEKHPDGGTVARVDLPLQQLLMEEQAP